MSMVLQSLRVNFAPAAMRTEFLEGEEYCVVPMVMAMEGVMNGSDGPLFYPGSEFADSAMVWNHKPIVVYHPMLNGKPISACSPEVLTARKVGLILNTTWSPSDNKLKAEAWLKKSKLAQVDMRVQTMLANGQKVEVSTGLFTEKEDKVGEYNGVPYVGVAKNYRPDHLAILPDMEGACSIKQGGGLLANYSGGYNKKERARFARKGIALPDGTFPIANETDLEQAVQLVNNHSGSAPVKAHLEKRAKALNKEEMIPKDWLVVNDLSFDHIYSEVRTLLATNYGQPGKSWDGGVEEIYKDRVIFYGDRYSDLYEQKYVVTNDKVQLSGKAVPVKRVTSYETDKARVTNNQETETMATRAERVAALITANVGWTKDEEKFLTDMPDAQFEKIEKHSKATQPTPQPVIQPVQTPVTAPVVNNGQQTIEQYIANAPPEIQQIIRRQMAQEKADKDRLIGVITANANNRFDLGYLQQRSVEELAGMAALCPQPQQVTNNGQVLNGPVFLGQATPVGGQGGTPAPTEGLGLPTVNYSNK